jgi:hypothetical protein
MTFLSELKKPFNLVSTVIAVFSILLSIYLYFQSLQKREPYYLQHSSSQIYKKSVVSPKITVIDDVGKPVVGDIHVVELSFWNNGKTPIEPSDVRTPIVLEFPDGYRLLDSKVVKENKPAVTRFKISDIPPSETAAPRVRLDWAHLDPGLGARLHGSGVLTNDTPIWIGIPVVLIILLFSGFVLPGFFGRYIPNRSNWITVTLGFTSLIVSNAIGLFLIALLLGPKIVPI